MTIAAINDTAAVLAAVSMRADCPSPSHLASLPDQMDINDIDVTLNRLLDTATQLVNAGRGIPDTLADSISALNALLQESIDDTLTDTIGCARFNPDAAPVSLAEPAIVFVGGDFYTAVRIDVYLPGHHYTAYTATDAAVSMLTEFTTTMHGLSPDTRHLTAAITPDQWSRIIPCEGVDHDWHPLPVAPRSLGASPITMVTLEGSATPTL